MMLKFLERYTAASINQLALCLSIRANDTHLRAQMYAVLDQLETVGMVSALRTPFSDSDLWALTANGRLSIREMA